MRLIPVSIHGTPNNTSLKLPDESNDAKSLIEYNVLMIVESCKNLFMSFCQMFAGDNDRHEYDGKYDAD